MPTACHQCSSPLYFALPTMLSMGLLGSLHCVGMCGPLSTLWTHQNTLKHQAPFAHLASYHTARLLSYSGAGFASWHLGQSLGKWLPQNFIWWTLFIILLSSAVGLSLRTPKFLQRIAALPLRQLNSFTPQQRALLMGLLTPLLPCGLFYAAIASSLLAPSAAAASLGMLVFALGTIPGLLSCQLGLGWLRDTIPLSWWKIFSRFALLAMACYVAWKQLELFS